MPTRNLLYASDIPINDNIKVMIPKVGQILDREDDYYELVSMLTAMPIDMMVALDDIGLDFTLLDDYQLFLLLFPGLKERDTGLVFGSLDLRGFAADINPQNGQPILVHSETGAVIDRAIHDRVATALRKIHHLEKNNKKPANKEAMDFMISRARKKIQRRKNKVEDSQLESLIVAMVNTEQFKYDFEGTLELSIYAFNECVRQIIKKVDYDNRMYGVYAGTIKAKDLSPDDLNWLTYK